MSSLRGSDDVVVWLIGDGHISLMDSSGRPIGERASARYASCPREERVVPFGDLRDDTGLPANIAALRQVGGCLEACMPALGAAFPDEPADQARLRARAEAMCLVAPLLALRDGGTAHVLHASAFKLCLGFREMQNESLLEGSVEADARVDADAVMSRLGVEPLLVGDAQVCAGSLKQIRAVLGALLAESPEELHPVWAPLREPWFTSAVAAVTTLHDLVAIAAATALALFDRGACDRGAVSAALGQLSRGPRISQALRARTDRAPLRVTLLYRADAVPCPVRAMFEELAARLAGPSALSLGDLDVLLVEHARPVAATLMHALGRAGAPPLSTQAFRAVCALS